MQTTKILNGSLVLSSLLCAVFFVVLFWSVRFEPDDMITSQQLSGNSLVNILVDKYYNTSFRPLFIVTSFLTIGYHAADVFQYYTSVFAYFLCLYSFFVFSIYKLLIELFSLQIKKVSEKLLVLSFANVLFASIYFFTTEKIEIFGWYCCSTIYLLPISILCFATYVLIKKNHHKADFILLFLCALLIAGGAEHVPASVIACAAVIMVILFFENRKSKLLFTKNKPIIVKTIFFTSILSVFFVAFVTNPGLWSHYDFAQSDVQKGQSKIQFIKTIKMFCKPTKLIGGGFLISVWLLFLNIFNIRTKKINLKYFAANFVVVVFVAIVTNAFAYNSLAVGRVWFVADVSFFVLLSALIIKYNSVLIMNSKILISDSLLMLTLLLFFNIRHIPALLYFSSEHDKIVKSLRQQDSGKVIILKSFPPPDLTNQVELSADTNNAENQLFCRFYNIKAKVCLKK